MNHSELRQKWIKNDAKMNYLRAETKAFSLATHVIRDWLWGHERWSQIFHPLIGECEFVLGIDLLEFQFPHQQMETAARRPASHRVCVTDAATGSSWEHCSAVIPCLWHPDVDDGWSRFQGPLARSLTGSLHYSYSVSLIYGGTLGRLSNTASQ